MPKSLDFFGGILQSAAVVLFFIGCAVSLAFATWLLIHPASALRFSRFLSTWIAADKVDEVMNAPRPTERHLYRHHRLYGAFLLAGGIYVLYALLAQDGINAVPRLLTMNRLWAAILKDSLSTLTIFIGLLGMIFGVLILIRPSILRGAESTVNRWISTDAATRPLNAPHEGLDYVIARHPRVAGTLILVATAYIVVIMVPLAKVLL